MMRKARQTFLIDPAKSWTPIKTREHLIRKLEGVSVGARLGLLELYDDGMIEVFLNDRAEVVFRLRGVEDFSFCFVSDISEV